MVERYTGMQGGKRVRETVGGAKWGGSLSKYPVVWKLASCHQSVCEGKRRGKAMGREESACRDLCFCPRTL